MDVLIPSQGDYAKFWINNNWIRFIAVYGTYSNIIDFFDSHNISFIKTNYINFDNVPINLHGFGNSYNLMDYLSNNAGNTTLICDFINYYLNILDFRYYYKDQKLVLNFYCNNAGWQISKLEVADPVPDNLTIDTILYTADDILITADQIYI